MVLLLGGSIISHNRDPAKKIEIRIKATGEGSFVIHLEIIESLVKTLLSPSGVSYASGLIASAVGVLELRKHLKGKKEAATKEVSEKTIQITNCDGGVVIIDKSIYHDYNSPVIEKGIDQTFDALQENSEVSSFNFLDSKDKPLFIARKKEFPFMVSNKVKDNSLPEFPPRIVTRKDTLSIIKPSFDSKLKWDVIAGSVQARISVKNSDTDFLNRVQLQKESFTAGDMLEVEMDVSQVWNETAKAYESKEYSIAKVLRHERGAVQIPLELPKPEDD